MKNLIIFITLLFQLQAFSQTTYVKEQNGIQRFFLLKRFEQKCNGVLQFKLENYVENSTSIYYIIAYFPPEDKQNHNFPCGSKLVLESFEGNVTELQSVMSVIHPTLDEHGCPMSFFYISADQIKALFDGISKIKIDILTYEEKGNTVNKECPEFCFKKDKFGIYLKKTYERIEESKKNNKYSIWKY